MLSESRLCLNPLKLFPSALHRLDTRRDWFGRLSWLASLQDASPRAAASAGQALLTELLLELLASETVEMKFPVQDERVRRALDLAGERCLDGLTVPEMAQAAGLGEVQFRKLFKRQTGLSPKQHLEELRMRKACELLRTGHLGTREVARILGFSGEWHFCSAFKRFAGLTPSAFKRQDAL